MPRWTQNLIWAAGAITVWCPYCSCLFGGESLWACFHVGGLMAIAITSGYVTWTILYKLLSKNASQYSMFTKLRNIFCNNVPNGEIRDKELENKTTGGLDIDDIESEISVFAQTFHTHFVLPWYTVVSPDEKYSRQIKCSLQDMLSNVVMHIQLNSKPCDLICSFVYLYIQHYRHFVKTLEKVSTKSNGIRLTDIDPEELSKSYIPIHCAMKSQNRIDEYCKKLSHIFLVDHLPHEITQCSLLFTIIRDAFAQNVLVVFLNRFSQPSFINELILHLISQETDLISGSAQSDSTGDAQSVDDGCEKVPMSYVHRLSLIHEESSVDLLETDLLALSRLLPETIIEEELSLEEVEEESEDHAADSCRTFDEMSIECALGALISTTAAPILSRQFPFPVGQIPSKINCLVNENSDNTFGQIVIDEIENSQYESFNSRCRKSSNEYDFPLIAKGLLRSSSLEDIVSTENPQTDLLQIQTITKMSFSSEDLRLVHRKGKKLVKMASFDKNDGTDEQSLRAERQEKQLSPCKNVICNQQISNNSGRSSETKDENSSNQIDTVDKCKSTSSTEESTELSPIYEESESLATAIAKLRSLLTEKESQTSLGSQSSFGSNESEPKSAQSDPGRYCLEKSRFNFLHKDSSGSLASIKSYSSSDSCCLEDVMEVPEVPFDGRVFINISIPTTEVNTDPIDGQYTHFVVQYDAIYLCESVSNDPSVSSNINGAAVSESKMILQTNSVKRRFGEFLALHAALEEDLNLKVILKTIKGPNKWLNLPFSKLDSATVSSRKQFLDKYLSTLIQRVELNISPQLKDFLAYSSKSSVSFVKKPLELNVPRIDKILARTVSGMFHSIKTALPTFDSIESNSNIGTSTIKSVLPFTDSLKPYSSEKRPIKSPINPYPEYKLKIDVTAEEDFCEMEGALVKEISSASFKNSPIEAAYEALETHQFINLFLAKREATTTEDSYTWGSESAENFWKELKRAVLLSCQQNKTLHDGNYRSSPDGVNLYFAISDLFVELLSTSDSVWTRHCTVKIMENLFLDDVSELLLIKVKSFFDPANFKAAIGFLSNLIEKSSMENHANSTSNPERLLADCTLYINSCLPGISRLLFHQEMIEKQIKLLISSLQHRSINLDLGLQVLDLVFSQFISK